MLIWIERTGGFAGIKLTHKIDTEKLSQEEATEVCKLIEDCKVFEQPPEIKANPKRPDRFNYKLKVKTENKEHLISFDEEAFPEGQRLNELFNYGAD